MMTQVCKLPLFKFLIVPFVLLLKREKAHSRVCKDKYATQTAICSSDIRVYLAEIMPLRAFTLSLLVCNVYFLFLLIILTVA